MPKIQMRRDTAANWASVNPTLLAGEWALETDTQKMKVGDGSTAYNSLSYFRNEDNEWTKPSDWPDIRSGALPNSVYFLVGHSADYSVFPKCGFTANTSSGTYDVYVDGTKLYTTASGQKTTLDWQALNLNRLCTIFYSGIGTTYTGDLDCHIIRVTPTTPTSTFTHIVFANTGIVQYNENVGCVWAHFSIDYPISLQGFSCGYPYWYILSILKAITATGDVIDCNNSPVNFTKAYNLVYLPLLKNGTCGSQGFYDVDSLKNLRLEDFALLGNSTYDVEMGSLKTTSIVNPRVSNITGGTNTLHIPSLLKFPDVQMVVNDSFSGSLDYTGSPAFLDFSNSTSARYIGLYNAPGVKGLTVSPEAPFDKQVSFQVDVHYTGLDRPALINLFESMPSRVGYTVVGSPTIESGIMSNISNTNYVQSKVKFPSDVTNFEFVTKFNATGYGACIVSAPSSTIPFHLSLLSSGKIRFYLGVESQSRDTSFVFSLNTAYYVKIVFENSTWKLLHSTDGTTYTQDISYVATASTIPHSNYVVLGRNYVNSGEPFQGSLDLSKTYIKINGLPWSAFDGITRTCNVKGCVGTSSLTEEDKNIALNKGWELTVA